MNGVVDRGATASLQIGLVAIVLAALPFKVFELDRYFVAKELVLHAVALVLAIAVLARLATYTIDAADVLIAGFLLWSVGSALFATNYWLAQRAVSISIASAIVFWSARHLAAKGLHRPILAAAAMAAMLAAIVGLAQAYGLETQYFSLNRAPGGTFGNRNFVAHFCVIGLPALVYMTVTARHSAPATVGTIGCGAVVALLVLSRSRAAWLAGAAMLLVLVPALIVARPYWAGQGIGGRLSRIMLTAVVTTGLAVFLPNRLNWRSDSPYLDSAMRVVDYSSGSGRGRIAQYLNSARMATDNPLFGVGPGNWPVLYPRFAPNGDPSMAGDGRTANPWPSSDWVAFVSERGALAAVALGAAVALLFFGAMRGWRELAARGAATPGALAPNVGDAVLARLVALGTIAATMTVSVFDAVLLLAAPALLAWSVIGATTGVGRRGRELVLATPRRVWLVVAVLVAQGIGLARSAAQVASINMVGQGGRRAGWVAGADWDPGSYRANLRAAQLLTNAGRCREARPYARQALSLFPDAPAAKQAVRACR